METNRRRNKELKPKAILLVEECRQIGANTCLEDIRRVMQLTSWWIEAGAIEVKTEKDVEGFVYDFRTMEECHIEGMRWVTFLVSESWVRDSKNRVQARTRILEGGVWAGLLYPDYFNGIYQANLYDDRAAFVNLMIEANNKANNGSVRVEPLGEIDWPWYQNTLGIELNGCGQESNFEFEREQAIERAERQTANLLRGFYE